MKQLDKENWVEQTLESLKGAQRAAPPPDLFEKSMRRAAQIKAIRRALPLPYVWSSAACALILIVANAFLCRQYTSQRKPAQDAEEMFAREYFGGQENLQI